MVLRIFSKSEWKALVMEFTTDYVFARWVFHYLWIPLQHMYGLYILQVFPDKFIRREVLALVVHCTFKEDGCVWKREVRHLEVCHIWYPGIDNCDFFKHGVYILSHLFDDYKENVCIHSYVSLKLLHSSPSRFHRQLTSIVTRRNYT